MRPEVSIMPERAKVVIEPRVPLKRIELAHLLVQQGGYCGCGCRVKVAPLTEGIIDEHIIPLAQGGTNALTNRRIFRKPCAMAKTKRDASDTARCQRLAGETCTAPTAHPLRGRGFDKTLTRGVNGKTRPRSTREAASAQEAAATPAPARRADHGDRS